MAILENAEGAGVDCLPLVFLLLFFGHGSGAIAATHANQRHHESEQPIRQLHCDSPVPKLGDRSGTSQTPRLPDSLLSCNARFDLGANRSRLLARGFDQHGSPGDRRAGVARTVGRTGPDLLAAAVLRRPSGCAARVRPRAHPGKPRATAAAIRGSLLARKLRHRARPRVSRFSDSVRSRSALVSASRNPRFPSLPKNLGNGLPLAGLDSGIQIHKIPAQPPGKFLPHAAFAGSHESHKKHRAHSHGAPSRSLGLRTIEHLPKT